ncbi:unnamed protein product [Albugo candida]|uniref:Uncharacterized protein n=1 Tax=Albugo candida TaxID=65357 RepID=A0A024GUN0_9STRA|nr:unnamed protein product [Albugo candida]|eukprot:CCI50481.1 unnamed protein product [Albugo candida]
MVTGIAFMIRIASRGLYQIGQNKSHSLNHLHTIGDTTKNCMFTIQPRRWCQRHKKLASIGILPRVRLVFISSAVNTINKRQETDWLPLKRCQRLYALAKNQSRHQSALYPTKLSNWRLFPAAFDVPKNRFSAATVPYFDNSMENGIIIVSVRSKLAKVVTCIWGVLIIQFYCEGSLKKMSFMGLDMKGLHAQCSFPPSRVSLEEKTSFSSEIEPKGKVHQALKSQPSQIACSIQYCTFFQNWNNIQQATIKTQLSECK